jgi:GGDEF domain-containing protein
MRHLIAYPGATVGACSLSIGMVLIDQDHHWNDAYSRADQALYLAKREGGNRAQWFMEETNESELFGVDHVQRD